LIPPANCASPVCDQAVHFKELINERNNPMQLAKWTFLISGIYGLILVTPMYFLENQIARDYPPAITHPESFYGFIGVTLAWQLLFLVLSTNPSRYRLMMLPAFVEKASYGIAIIWLFIQQRVPGLILGFALVDLIWGVLFLIAFWRTGVSVKAR
jgi:hypothetical protein